MPTTTARYIDQLRPLTETGTNYGIAKLLGLTETTVARYMSGERFMCPAVALQVAQLLQLDPLCVIAQTQSENEKDPDHKAAWERYCPSRVKGSTCGRTR